MREMQVAFPVCGATVVQPLENPWKIWTKRTIFPKKLDSMDKKAPIKRYKLALQPF
jgi:hypothetical protein